MQQMVAEFDAAGNRGFKGVAQQRVEHFENLVFIDQESGVLIAEGLAERESDAVGDFIAVLRGVVNFIHEAVQVRLALVERETFRGELVQRLHVFGKGQDHIGQLDHKLDILEFVLLPEFLVFHQLRETDDIAGVSHQVMAELGKKCFLDLFYVLIDHRLT